MHGIYRYTDRWHAGQMLADRLKGRLPDNTIVLAMPNGGVPVAYALAQELGLPVELLLSETIGHPYATELAIGSVGLHGRPVVNAATVPQIFIEEETRRIHEMLRRRHSHFVGHESYTNVAGKTVLIVDDGSASGSMIRAAIERINAAGPARIYVALPVASTYAAGRIAAMADELICLMQPESFHLVEEFYCNYSPVSDEMIGQLLRSEPCAVNSLAS